MAVAPSETVACKVTRDLCGTGAFEDGDLVGFGHRSVSCSIASAAKRKA